MQVLESMNIENLLNRFDKEEDKDLIVGAYSFLLEKLNQTEEKKLLEFLTGLTDTLTEFKADCKTIVSSFLSVLLYRGTSIEEIESKFGNSIAEISSKLATIYVLRQRSNLDGYHSLLEQLQVESEEDVRTSLVILSERLYEMRNMQNESSEIQKNIANETISFLLPMATRMRLGFIKSKLEDICLFYLEPQVYNSIVGGIGGTPDALKVGLNEMKNSLSHLLTENDIAFSIKDRVKSIYSIYCKLSSGKTLDEIYDVLAFRILVDDEDMCNRAIELIHSKYTPLPSRFKDYISNPKENMYQSLHTTVIGPDGKFYEIQVRTQEMDKTAEIGSASHATYKERKRDKK